MYRIILVILCTSLLYAQSRFEQVQIQAVNDTDGTTVENLRSQNGYLQIYNNWGTDIFSNLFLYRLDTIPILTESISLGDDTLNVVSTTGISVGQVITIYECSCINQSLVVATTATQIIMSTGSDHNFSDTALVEVGTWEMNVDGSITPQTFYIKAPPEAEFHIYTVNGTILDATVMDDSRFGGILGGLTNGIVYQFENDIEKKVAAIIVNNTGFYEFGFETNYSTKAPAGLYGFQFRVNIPQRNGVIVKIEGADNGKFELIVRDDLTELDQMTTVAIGHLKIKR